MVDYGWFRRQSKVYLVVRISGLQFWSLISEGWVVDLKASFGMWVALNWNHGCVGVLFLDFWGRSEAD